MVKEVEVYLGLGGNLGQAAKTIDQTIEHIKSTPGIANVQTSRYYLTTPVSSIPQNDFVNAVCRLNTVLNPRQLLEKMQLIELLMGKVPKSKKDPRIIDIDILFYGTDVIDEPDLEIPHPRWKQRLFVLQPLLDLTEELAVPDPANAGNILTFNVRTYLKHFPNINNERVILNAIQNTSLPKNKF